MSNLEKIDTIKSVNKNEIIEKTNTTSYIPMLYNKNITLYGFNIHFQTILLIIVLIIISIVLWYVMNKNIVKKDNDNDN
jgi:hypothetical protein